MRSEYYRVLNEEGISMEFMLSFCTYIVQRKFADDWVFISNFGKAMYEDAIYYFCQV